MVLMSWEGIPYETLIKQNTDIITRLSRDCDIIYSIFDVFYERDYFSRWAEANNMDVEFYDSNVDGYWSNEFVFDVFFYKKAIGSKYKHE